LWHEDRVRRCERGTRIRRKGLVGPTTGLGRLHEMVKQVAIRLLLAMASLAAIGLAGGASIRF